MLREAVIWKRAKHPCVLQFFGMAVIENILCLVIEHMPAHLGVHVKNNPDIDRVRLVILQSSYLYVSLTSIGL